MANRFGRAICAGMLWSLLAMAGAASGQNQWVIDVAYSDPEGVINSLDDTATVTLWATWDPQNYAYARSILDVTADDALDAGIWSNPERLLIGPGEDGTVDGESVVDVMPFQVHFPEAGIFANTDNPIRVWTASWQAFDLSPRSVSVVSSSTQFHLYTNDAGNVANFIDSLHEGSGQIKIVPGPGVATLLILVIGHRHLRRRPS